VHDVAKFHIIVSTYGLILYYSNSV